MREFLLVENIYRRHIELAVGTRKEAEVWLREKTGQREHIPTADGKTMWKEGGRRFYVWVRQRDNLPVLSHELLHCAVATLQSAGVPINVDTDEALTYLHQSLFIDALLKLGLGKFCKAYS